MFILVVLGTGFNLIILGLVGALYFIGAGLIILLGKFNYKLQLQNRFQRVSREAKNQDPAEKQNVLSDIISSIDSVLSHSQSKISYLEELDLKSFTSKEKYTVIHEKPPISSALQHIIKVSNVHKQIIIKYETALHRLLDDVLIKPRPKTKIQLDKLISEYETIIYTAGSYAVSLRTGQLNPDPYLVVEYLKQKHIVSAQTIVMERASSV